MCTQKVYVFDCGCKKGRSVVRCPGAKAAGKARCKEVAKNEEPRRGDCDACAAAKAKANEDK